MTRPAGVTTVVACDGAWFKLVRAAATVQGRAVTTVRVVPLSGANDAEAISAVRAALQNARLTLGPVWVSVPSHSTTVRVLALPSTNPQEIRDIVDLQVEKHTPHARDEILTDAKILDSDPSGYSRVLLAIAHRDVVQRGVAVAEGAGGVVDRVGCEVEGLVTWFRLVARAQQGASSDGATVLADVGQETTTLVILHHGQPIFHRSIGYGLVQLADSGSDGAATLVGELQRSLEGAEAEGVTFTVADVILIGVVDRLSGLRERIQQALGAPTRVAPVFEHCPSTREAAAAGTSAEVSLAGLVGLALGTLELDLTPPAVRLRKAFMARVRALITMGYQLVGVALLLLGVALEKTYGDQRTLANLTREYQLVSPQADRIAEALDQLSVAKQRLPRRGTLLEVFDAVSRLSPDAVELQSLTFTAGDAVVLKGVSKELPKVYEFVSELGKIPVFTHVEARRVAKRKVEGHDITDFEITCTLAVRGS